MSDDGALVLRRWDFCVVKDEWEYPSKWLELPCASIHPNEVVMSVILYGDGALMSSGNRQF